MARSHRSGLTNLQKISIHQFMRPTLLRIDSFVEEYILKSFQGDGKEVYEATHRHCVFSAPIG